MRRRFNPVEKESFTPGTYIEWRNGGHWHEGVITDGVVRDEFGREHVTIRHTGRNTRTIHTGLIVWPGPTFVRYPPVFDVARYNAGEGLRLMPQGAYDRTQLVECGECHRKWDDSIVTATTPAPSARCPFEYEHGVRYLPL